MNEVKITLLDRPYHLLWWPERWRDIDFIDSVDSGLYWVSNKGTVRSSERVCGHRWGGYAIKRSRILKGSKSHGYVYYSLRSDGRNKKIGIHRLVATAFITNPYRKPEVNHIDGIKTHNWASNLEWCTRLENARHASDMGLLKSGSSNPMYGKRRGECVNAKVVVDCDTNTVYQSVIDAAEALGLGRSNMYSMLNGWKKNKTTLVYLDTLPEHEQEKYRKSA